MRDRAVSEVLSFALVFGLIVSSVAIVSVSGLGTLQDARDAEQIDNAERAFDVLADNLADTHQRNAPSRATEISLGDAQLYTATNTTMTVEVSTASSSGPVFSREYRIRPIVYSGNQDRELAYVGGGVFRTNRDGRILVRGPPLIADDTRLLVSVVGVNSPDVQSLGGSTVLVRADHRGSSTDFENRNDAVDNVTIHIDSDSPQREALWRDALNEKGFTNCDPGCTYEPSSTNIDRVYVVYHDIEIQIDQ